MANQRLNAVISIGGTVTKAFTSSIGLTQKKIGGVGDAIKDVESQQRRIGRFDIPGLLETRDQLRQAKRNVQQLSDELAQSRASTRQASKAYDGARDRVAELADEMRQADEPSEILRHDFEEAKKEAERLGKEFKEAEKQTARLAREQKAGARSVSALESQLEEQRDTLRRTRDELRGAGVDTRNLTEESERLAQQLEKLKRRQEAWQRVRSSGGQVGSTFSNMTTEVGALSQKIAMVGGAATLAVGTVVHSFATGAEATDQWAKRLGLSTAALSRWQYAGQQFGVQSDAMIDAFKELSLRTDEFVTTAGGPAAEAFERLGLTQEELAAVSDDTGALFNMVLGKMREVDNAAKRQRLADEFFGGQGGEQLAEMVSATEEEISKLLRTSDELGVTIFGKGGKAAREYMSAWRGVTGAMLGVRNTFGMALMPVLTDGFNQFTQYVKDNQEGIQNLATTLGEKFKAALPVITELATGFGTAAVMVGTVIGNVAELIGGFDNLGIVVGLALSAKAILSIFSFGGAIFSAGKALISLTGVLPMVATGIKAIGMALMANPIGLIIGGIALAAGLIIANWDTVGPWFAALWDGIKSVASTAWEWFKTLLSWSPLGLVVNSWGGISGWFSGLWDGITASAQKAIDWIAGKLEWVGNAFSKVSGWLGFGDDEEGQQSGASPRTLSGAPPRPSFSVPDVQASGAGAASGAMKGAVATITNNLTLHISRSKGEGDESYARRITDMVIDELNERQQGALYDNG